MVKKILLGLSVLSIPASAEPYMVLEDFDYYDDEDYEYVDISGVIRRPDLGIVIPVTVQYDGSVLLGDPPVDKIPSRRVRKAVCGREIHFDELPPKILECP